MFELKREMVPWTTRQTLNGVFLTLVPWLVLTLLLSVFSTSTNERTPLPLGVDAVNAVVDLVFSLLVYGAFLLAPFYFATRAVRTGGATDSMRATTLSLLGWRRFAPWRTILTIIALFLGILLVNEGYSVLINVLHLHVQTNDQVLLQRGKTSPIATYVTLLIAVVVAPVCEEIFFRSVVFMGLLRDMSLGWAIVLSSLIFAIAHGDPNSFVVLFVIGAALAFLRWRTRSVWPGIMLHMLNNAASALVIVLTLNHVL